MRPTCRLAGINNPGIIVSIDYMSIKGGNMQSLGMLALGTFIGWVVSYGLLQVTNWANPGNVFSAVISAAVAGVVRASVPPFSCILLAFLTGRSALH
jgi:hypothetical protein